MARSEWALGARLQAPDVPPPGITETQDGAAIGHTEPRVVGAGVRVQLGGPERAQMIALYSHVRRIR